MSRLCPLMITGRGWFETGTHGDIGRCLSQRYGAIRIIISRPLWEFVSVSRLCPLMITGRGWFETGTHENIGRCLSQQYCGVVGPGCVVNSADRVGFVHHLCYYECDVAMYVHVFPWLNSFGHSYGL